MVLRRNLGGVKSHKGVVPLGDETKYVVASKAYAVQIDCIPEISITRVNLKRVDDYLQNLSPTDWGSSNRLKEFSFSITVTLS